jgi:hypothetical protein
MKIEIAEITIATKDVPGLKTFFAGLLGEGCEVADHDFFFKLTDQAKEGCISVVPHNGDTKWDKPWITFATDDMAGALSHLEAIGATDVQNSGPTDDDGNPIACVTFRDPEGRLMMLATSD